MSYQYNNNRRDGMSAPYNNPQQFPNSYQRPQQPSYRQLPVQPIKPNMVLPDFSVPPPNYHHPRQSNPAMAANQHSESNSSRPYYNASHTQHDLKRAKERDRGSDKSKDRSRDQERYGDRDRVRDRKRGRGEPQQELQRRGDRHQHNHNDRGQNEDRSYSRNRPNHNDKAGPSDHSSRRSQQQLRRQGDRYQQNHNDRCQNDDKSYSRERNQHSDREKRPPRHNSHAEPSTARKKCEHSGSRRSSQTDARSSSGPTKRRKVASPQGSSEPERRATIERNASSSRDDRSERSQILAKWCSNFCETSEDITRKLEELADDSEKKCWTRSSPADLFYRRSSTHEMESTSRLDALCTLFRTELVDRGEQARKAKPPIEAQTKKIRQRVCRHKSELEV